MKEFFSMFINENSTIVIIFPFLEGKSINAEFKKKKKHKEFFLEIKPHFQKLLMD